MVIETAILVFVSLLTILNTALLSVIIVSRNQPVIPAGSPPVYTQQIIPTIPNLPSLQEKKAWVMKDSGKEARDREEKLRVDEMKREFPEMFE